eukprot:365318-Chlamydomonas_euryale.AAC.11
MTQTENLCKGQAFKLAPAPVRAIPIPCQLKDLFTCEEKLAQPFSQQALRFGGDAIADSYELTQAVAPWCGLTAHRALFGLSQTALPVSESRSITSCDSQRALCRSHFKRLMQLDLRAGYCCTARAGIPA